MEKKIASLRQKYTGKELNILLRRPAVYYRDAARSSGTPAFHLTFFITSCSLAFCISTINSGFETSLDSISGVIPEAGTG